MSYRIYFIFYPSLDSFYKVWTSLRLVIIIYEYNFYIYSWRLLFIFFIWLHKIIIGRFKGCMKIFMIFFFWFFFYLGELFVGYVFMIAIRNSTISTFVKFIYYYIYGCHFLDSRHVYIRNIYDWGNGFNMMLSVDAMKHLDRYRVLSCHLAISKQS